MGQPPEIEQLLAALREDAPWVRCAGLAALISLPLTDEQWLQVARYVADGLTDPSVPEWERERCLNSVPRIPVRALRDLTARLAGEGDLAAAYALVKAEDPRGSGFVRNLLFPEFEAATTDEQRAIVARRLASVGDQRVVPFLRKRCRWSRKRAVRLARADLARTDHGPPLDEASISGDWLWLAVALARAGHEDELKRFMEEWERGRVVEPSIFWGDPEQAYREIAASGPVPRLLKRRLRPGADGP